MFDLYRFGERREALVRTKLDAIIATDKEIRALEETLGTTGDRVLEVRAPGIGGRCPTCGAFHASDARFCATCGTDVATPPAPEVEPAPPPTAPLPPEPAPEEVVVAAEPSPAGEVSLETAPAQEISTEDVPAEEAPAQEIAAEESAPSEEMAPEEEPVAPPEAVETNGAGPRADDGEIAAVGPRRGQRSQSRPHRRRGSSR